MESDPFPLALVPVVGGEGDSVVTVAQSSSTGMDCGPWILSQSTDGRSTSLLKNTFGVYFSSLNPPNNSPNIHSCCINFNFSTFNNNFEFQYYGDL